MRARDLGCSLKSVERGFKDRVLRPVRRHIALELSRHYRTVLQYVGNVCFVGVTGSCGKTTTTELIGAILAREGRVRTGSHDNTTRDIARTIRTVSPIHRFCVQEVSGHAVGAMAASARLLRPRIGVVTHVGQDHHSSFRNLESTAAEKGKLVEALPVDGTAVLNADDPHVYAMRTRTRARVITYGLSDEAAVRAENVTCVWPERMAFDLCYAGKRVHVQTQLLGTHWVHTVLAGLSAALAAGVSLERAVEAVEAFEPVLYRMSPHESPEGVTFVSDTCKAPLWTVPASLEFLRAARAKRKILVVGSISDTSKNFYRRYKAVSDQACDIAEKILFVGDRAETTLRIPQGPGEDRIMVFATLYELVGFLRRYLWAGDLVLIKGGVKSDHLHRIVLAQTDEIACWREKCGMGCFCQGCHLQYNAFVPTEVSIPHGVGDNRKG